MELLETVKNITIPFLPLSLPLTLPLYFLVPALETLSLAFLLSKVLGILVMFLCAMMKIPQIFALLKSKSPKGFPIQPLLLENFAFSIHISYNLRAGLSLTVWGECLFLFIENSILLFLYHVYNKDIPLFFAHHSVFIAFPLLISSTLSVGVHEWLMLLTIPLFLTSSFIQLRNNQRNQHIGQLSPASMCMGLICSVCRLYTTIMEVPKPHFILISFINVLVATAFVLQMLLFKENTKKFLQEISSSQQQQQNSSSSSSSTEIKEEKKLSIERKKLNQQADQSAPERALVGNKKEVKAD